MRIVHLVPTEIEVLHPRGGAVQRRALAMATEQSSRGHQVTILSPGGLSQSVSGVRVAAIDLKARRPLRDLEYLWKARRAIADIRPDVIHSHGAPLAGAIIGKGPWVNVHTVDYFYYSGSRSAIGRLIYGWLLNRFDATAPVSDYCRREFLRYYGRYAPRNVEVIFNGVDLGHFRPSESAAGAAREKFSLRSYVLYVGRVNEQKGCDLLAELPGRLPADVDLVLAGPTEQFGNGSSSPLVAGIEGAGGIYLGPVDEDDLPGLMAGASLLVLPTRRHEMFGMVLVEAGACGVPAVASRIGGIPEALGVGGLMFEPEDADEMAHAVRQLLDSPTQLSALRAAALQNAERFSWSLIVDDYERLGQKVAL